MPIYLTDKILPKNNGFTGLVDAEQVIGLSGFMAEYTKTIALEIVDANVAVTIGDGVIGIPINNSLDGFYLSKVFASVYYPGTGTGTTDIQIRRSREDEEVDMLTTPTKIISTSYYSYDGVVNPSNRMIELGDLLFVDVDGVNQNPPSGLSVALTLEK
jgi:hypothetical protein